MGRNKYRAEKTNGYDSKKEACRAAELKLMESTGRIQNLNEQVRFCLVDPFELDDGKKIRGVYYIADFVYWQDGKLTVEDVKGYKKGQAYQMFVLKKKLMYQRYGVWVNEI